MPAAAYRPTPPCPWSILPLPAVPACHPAATHQPWRRFWGAHRRWCPRHGHFTQCGLPAQCNFTIVFTVASCSHFINKFVKNTEKELASRGCRRSLMRTPLPELRAAGDSSLDGSRSWRNLESTGGGNNSHGKYHTEKNRFSMSGMGFSKRASGRSEERIGFRKCAVFELTTYVSLSVHKR